MNSWGLAFKTIPNVGLGEGETGGRGDDAGREGGGGGRGREERRAEGGGTGYGVRGRGEGEGACRFRPAIGWET